MNFTYKKCTSVDIGKLIDEYVETLSSPFDSFLEDHIEASDFYTINDESNIIGYFAFNKDGYITQFYLRIRLLNIEFIKGEK